MSTPGAVCQRPTRRSASWNGRGSGATVLTMLKIATFAPIPNARVSSVASVNIGVRTAVESVLCKELSMSNVSRRTFLNTTAAGTGFTILPRHVLGRGFQAPSDTVNIATVGFGGMGGSNTRRLMSQNIVAICDVDDGLVDAQLKRMVDDAASAPASPRNRSGSPSCRRPR